MKLKTSHVCKYFVKIFIVFTIRFRLTFDDFFHFCFCYDTSVVSLHAIIYNLIVMLLQNFVVFITSKAGSRPF